MKRLLVLLASLYLFGAAAFALETDGLWSGKIKVGAEELQLEFLAFGERATLNVPSLGVYWYPAELSISGPVMSFSSSVGETPILLKGARSKDSIKGEVSQGNLRGSFELSRKTIPGTKPFFLDSGRGGLYSVLELPENLKGKYPVALILGDSGPTSLDGNSYTSSLGRNDCLKLLAAGLKARGIASLRYDKRGTGMSSILVASEADLRFSDHINDAVAAINYLKKDGRFSKVIVIGHGAGALVGMVAARLAGAQGFVSLSSSGYSAYELIKYQLANEPEPLRSSALAILESLKAGKRVESVSDSLKDLFRPSIQDYMISWFSYDPKLEIAKLNCPILLISGDNDLQVALGDLDILKKSSLKATSLIIPEMNHVLKIAARSPELNMKAYQDPTIPLAATLVPAILSFISGIKS